MLLRFASLPVVANVTATHLVFDYLNVGSIHNASIPSSSLLTNETKARLFSLASTHEWNLAYSSAEPVRAIAGSVLAGQVVQALEPLANAKKSPKFNIQFGAYGTFMSFFGLAGLPSVSNDFYGICDYASAMAFELVTNSSAPTPDDVSVRFLFANGTAAQNEFKPYPLFGQKDSTIKWSDFKSGMNKFAVGDTQKWCDVCGNASGRCANSTSAGDASTNSSGGSGNGGVSKPVAGVIGALVTLVVILGLEAAFILLGGLRLVKKSALAKGTQAAAESGSKTA